jgi:hypothetical protein
MPQGDQQHKVQRQVAGRAAATIAGQRRRSRPTATTPTATRDPVASPCSARNASASTGGPSLTRLFPIPVISTARVLRPRENPQESNIA